jgi:molybdopterin-synthase adenylyltransferase
MLNRYSRQQRFEGIGVKGQELLGQSTAVVLGCGALGTLSAGLLVRAGVGRVRIVDRDIIELHNLQRQHLFDEADVAAGLPKAIAAQRKLEAINSEVVVEGVVADIAPDNILELIGGADVVVDGLDNFEARLLVNDACLSAGIPWVYGGAVSAHGAVMVVRPGETACFACLVPEIPTGSLPTCETVGVVAPAPTTVAALQVAEVLKLLSGAAENLSPDLVSIDLWQNSFTNIHIDRRVGCAACAGTYRYLSSDVRGGTEVMCSAVQVRPLSPRSLDLGQLAGQLDGLGEVTANEHMLRFEGEGVSFVLFPDGRAIINDTVDEAVARGTYSKYIGT